MNRLRHLALLIVLIAAACGEPQTEPGDADTAQLAADPASATYTVGTDEVTLAAGVAERPAAPGSASIVRTSIVGEPIRGDLDGDGDDDIVLWLAQETGGTGTFFYVAAALSESGGYRGTTAAFIGDRIEPRGLTVVDRTVRADYLDRPVGAPMASPPTSSQTAFFSLGPDGLEPTEPDPNAAVMKADLIVVTSPAPNTEIRSPLRVEGRARGNWFFEGDFPVVLLDADGDAIATSFASARGEWMTTQFVPFEGEIEFEAPSGGGRATLIFRKDNPSDLRELDDELEVPVRLSVP